VSRFARESGMKVVLSGLGGDEVFGGYPTFAGVPRLAKLGRMMDLVPGLARLTGARLKTLRGSPRLMRLGTMLTRTPGVPAAYRAFRAVFSRSVALSLARRYLHDLPQDLPDSLDDQVTKDMHELDQVSLLELTLYMRNQLLKDSDTMSMAHGLELRVPFVDVELIEAVTRVAAPVRLRAGKQMLLEAVPEVPDFVSQGKKRGFEFPFQKWLQSSWGEEFASVSRSLPVIGPTWYQRWCVFVFERWLAGGA
jgi:asparagine synthase (glutamine-hydrolysing)